ncbi:MAG TPA: hypothetical protein VFV39_07375 [Limnobacter sp.]|nr:hypothetical protein [Limnobacter sp.]
MRQAFLWVNHLNTRIQAGRQRRLQQKLQKRLGKLVSYGLS